MFSTLSYLHGALTIVEGTFNVLGYLPREHFSDLNQTATSWRIKFGLTLTIVGLALTALGFLIDLRTGKSANPQKYLSLAQKIKGFGLVHANHGALNVIRAYIERQGLGCLTLAYDFYGRKCIPSLSPTCDFPTLFFEGIKRQLDHVQFISLFPPKILLRSYK